MSQKERQEWGEGGMLKEQEKTLGDYMYAHCLDDSDGFMGTDIPQNVPDSLL